MIYEKRPSQCAGLECWDTSTFMELYDRPRLTRKDLFPGDEIQALIEEHDRRCAYLSIERAVKRIGSKGKQAVKDLIDLVQYDHRVRGVAVREMGHPPESTDLLFGRSLTRTLPMFGIKAENQPDGSIVLKRYE